MCSLSKEENNILKKERKAEQERKYVLSQKSVQELFEYLEEQLDKSGCDHTLHHTKQWLIDNISEKMHTDIIEEIADMGGYCDCEVLLNCYEDYDIC